MSPDPLDLSRKRILIFVVAYNAETTIASVLHRMPASLRHGNVEVLVIDDSSKDGTFAAGLAVETAVEGLKVTILKTPHNQGYGGNQKLGYRYAIENNFDIVALVHGDGQYAPEKLPDLVAPLLRGEADAVFGSRMLEKGGRPPRRHAEVQMARATRRLPGFQNAMLGIAPFGVPLRLPALLRGGPASANPVRAQLERVSISTPRSSCSWVMKKKLTILEVPIPDLLRRGNLLRERESSTPGT